MAVHKDAAQPSARDLVEFGPPVADRASLEASPGVGVIDFYFPTEAASRALEKIGATLASGRGAVFWIGGPPGAGKSHFLNYLMALEERAGGDAARRFVARLGFDRRAQADDLERKLFDAIAHEIGNGGRGAALWRQMHGAQAIRVALEQLHRLGVRSVSVAIDFGQADVTALAGYFAELADAAAASRHLSFSVYAAARADAPKGAIPLQVAPADADEMTLAALARVRRLIDESAADALYRDADTGGFEPRAIFPFHPMTLKALRAIGGPSATMAAIARLAGEVLTVHSGAARKVWTSPVMPAELRDAAGPSKCVDERLGEAGRTALRIAHGAADAMEDRAWARDMADTLMLEYLVGEGAALSVRELRLRLPGYSRSRSLSTSGAAGLLAALAANTGGVIAFDARGARFNPRAAGAPEVAAFNRSLPLIRRFDSTLSEAAEFQELRAKLKRLSGAMASVLEGAHRVAAILEAAERETRGELPGEHRRTLEDFIALAEGGPDRLVEVGADEGRRNDAARLVAAYEALVVAASAVPRMRAMREYLRATALMPDLEDDGQTTVKAVAALEVECQLLLAALNVGVLPAAPRNLDALEARFQKFKWTYVQLYRGAHDRWRRDIDRVVTTLEEARERCAALRRLNSIAALGEPEGADLAARIDELGRAATRCSAGDPLAPEVAPRCPQCGFVLGMTPSAPELGDVLDQVDRALKKKLTALSHGAIARLIRQHDRGHRLDGFLRITQAAHTDALVRVIDDDLTGYLTRLLEESPERAPAVLKPFARPRRAKPRSGVTKERPVKPPHTE